MLVFFGMLMGRNMDLNFSPLELTAIVMAVYLSRTLIYDGESSWLEGLILVGVSVTFGVVFFYQAEAEPLRLLAPPPAAAVAQVFRERP